MNDRIFAEKFIISFCCALLATKVCLAMHHLYEKEKPWCAIYLFYLVPFGKMRLCGEQQVRLEIAKNAFKETMLSFWR